MTIYNINLGIGWASSGVEYAQMYRSKSFNRIGADVKFVFMDMISYENIQHLTNNIGLIDEQIIWLYQYFTDIKISKTTYSVKNLLESIDEEPVKYEWEGDIAKYYFDGGKKFCTCYLVKDNHELINRVEFVSNGCLIRKDYYTYTKLFSEFYVPEDGRAKLYQRVFYNEDGSVALQETIDGDDIIYRVKENIFYSKEEFIEFFIKSLNLTSKDLILIDRATGVGQPILRARGDAKVGTIIHADHFSENSTDEHHILWNNYYEFEFHNADKIDFLVAATESQSKLVREQFKKYRGFEPKVYTIPVGNLEELKYPKKDRIANSLVTASRLAPEKHIDWLIRAMNIVHKELPDLKLDIYGSGVEQEALEKLIKELKAEHYIKLKGHVKLDEVYKNYEVYLSASTSEGFGLTLMEAIGSGLPIIGFNVRYGNPTFVDDEKNGYLIEKSDDMSVEEIAKAFYEKIIMIYDGNLKSKHRHSYKKAKEYLAESIDKKWTKLIEEVLDDKLI